MKIWRNAWEKIKSHEWIVLAVMVSLLVACQTILPPTTSPLPTGESTAVSTKTSIPATQTVAATEPPATATAPSKAEGTVISVENIKKLAGKVTEKVVDPLKIHWSLDGKQVGVSSTEGLQVFAADTLKKLAEFELNGKDTVVMSDFNLENGLVALTDMEGTLIFVDFKNGQEVSRPKVDMVYSSFNFSPDGTTFLTNSIDELKAALWNTNDGTKVKDITGFETAAPVYSLGFNQDGTKLIFHSRANLQVIDLKSGELGGKASNEDFFSAYSLSPDTSTLAAVSAATIDGEFAPAVLLYDAQSGKKLEQKKLGENEAMAIDYSPDGKLLATAVRNQLFILESATLKEVFQISTDDGDITGIAFSPAGDALLTLHRDGLVTLWEIAE